MCARALRLNPRSRSRRFFILRCRALSALRLAADVSRFSSLLPDGDAGRHLYWIVAAPMSRRSAPPGNVGRFLLAPQLWLWGVYRCDVLPVPGVCSWVVVIRTTVMKVPATPGRTHRSLVLLLGIVSAPIGGLLRPLRRTVGNPRPLSSSSLVMIASGCQSRPLFVPGPRRRAWASRSCSRHRVGLPYAAHFTSRGSTVPGRPSRHGASLNKAVYCDDASAGAPLVDPSLTSHGTFRPSFRASLVVFSPSVRNGDADLTETNRCSRLSGGKCCPTLTNLLNPGRLSTDAAPPQGREAVDA